MSKDFDQLAAVLKSCGIVASQYDAKMMAENIDAGVRQNSVYYADAYRRIMGTGKREESRAPLPDTDSNITNRIHRDPVIENIPLEPEKEVITNIPSLVEGAAELSEAALPLEQEAMPEQEAAHSIISDEVAEVQDIAESIIREKEVESPSPKAVVSPEPKVDIEIMPIEEAPASKSPEPIAAAPSLHSSEEEMQLKAKQMAEQMMQQMVAQQAAQQKELQEQILKQQQQIAQMNAQQAAMKEAMQKPAPQQAVVQEKPRQQVFSYPQKEAPKKSGFFVEIPVDKSKPKATLTKEEEKATDITKWFNFSGGRR